MRSSHVSNAAGPPGPRAPGAGLSLSWDAQDRDQALDQATTRDVALVIVGGGITGAGIAREAALRGLSFLLVDRADFAFGTSSRSSKLVHGGMRYLAQGDFRLVREATTERNWLCAALPNLVRPVGFYYCARPGTPDTPRRIRTALVLYDLLGNTGARFKGRRHRILAPAQLRQREPSVDTSGITMAGLFYDANVDDARLTLEVLKEARNLSAGRGQILNYVEAAEVLLEEGQVRGVRLRDRLGDRAFTVPTRCVVNATGIWTGAFLGKAGMIRPTKGVHLAIPNARLGNREAFVLRSQDDGRTFFVLRRGEVTLIGTTDTDYQGSLDAPFCTREDCDYLLRTVNTTFPASRITTRDILSTYAGIRPLVMEEGKPASQVSRRHLILDPGSGLVTLVGGKLTTFRLMAWELLTLCSRSGYLRPFRGRERHRHFSRRPFTTGITWVAFQASLAAQGLTDLVPEATLRHLHQQYGRGALAILAEIQADPGAGQPLVQEHPCCPAEIRHILAFENAPTLADLMLRRTELQVTVSHRIQADLAARVAELMGCHYGWDPLRAGLETAQYLGYLRNTLSFDQEAND